MDKVTQDKTFDSFPGWFDIDPWGSAPDTASKLPGLGGSKPADDPGYVFGTAFLSVAPGPLRMRIIFEGHEPSEAAFLLEVLNRSSLPGSPPVRMRLEIATMQAVVAADGHYDISIEARPNTQYALSAYLHSDQDLGISRIRVVVDREADALPIGQLGGEAPVEISSLTLPVRDTVRLTSGDPPSFTNPFSQAWTASQEHEPAFYARCAELDIQPVDPQLTSWSEAYVLQVLGKYGALASGRSGVGFDCSGQALAKHLISRGSSILLTRFDGSGAEIDLGSELQGLRTGDLDDATFSARASFTTLPPCSLPAGYFGRFDFAWWIASGDTSPSGLSGQLNAVASSLRPGGLGVLVVPFDPGRAFALGLAVEHAKYAARHAIERLALEAVAQGRSIAQLRFGPPIEASGADVSRFGLIVLRE